MHSQVDCSSVRRRTLSRGRSGSSRGWVWAWEATADDWNFCGSGQREILSSSSFCFPTKSPKSHPWQTDTAKNSGANLSRQYMAVLSAVRSADFCFQSELTSGCCKRCAQGRRLPQLIMGPNVIIRHIPPLVFKELHRLLIPNLTSFIFAFVQSKMRVNNYL